MKSGALEVVTQLGVEELLDMFEILRLNVLRSFLIVESHSHRIDNDCRVKRQFIGGTDIAKEGLLLSLDGLQIRVGTQKSRLLHLGGAAAQQRDQANRGKDVPFRPGHWLAP